MSHASGIDIGTGGSVGDTYVDIKGEHNVNGYRCTVCGKTWHSASEITNAHAGTVYFYYCSDFLMLTIINSKLLLYYINTHLT